MKVNKQAVAIGAGLIAVGTAAYLYHKSKKQK